LNRVALRAKNLFHPISSEARSANKTVLMIRKVLPATFALLLLAVPPARAEDPLLSGYAGPGGGDQAVLGSQLIGAGGKGGGGGGPSSGAGSAAGSRSLQAPPPAPAPSGAAASGSGSGSGSGASSGTSNGKADRTGRSGAKGSRGSARRPGSASSTPGASARRPAPAIVAPTYPSARASGAGALPFSGEDVLLALLGAGVVAAVAAATLRLTRARPEPGL
jgi:hypothetical protein